MASGRAPHTAATAACHPQLQRRRAARGRCLAQRQCRASVCDNACVPGARAHADGGRRAHILSLKSTTWPTSRPRPGPAPSRCSPRLVCCLLVIDIVPSAVANCPHTPATHTQLAASDHRRERRNRTRHLTLDLPPHTCDMHRSNYCASLVGNPNTAACATHLAMIKIGDTRLQLSACEFPAPVPARPPQAQVSFSLVCVRQIKLLCCLLALVEKTSLVSIVPRVVPPGYW